jgi:hypothetical protein
VDVDIVTGTSMSAYNVLMHLFCRKPVGDKRCSQHIIFSTCDDVDSYVSKVQQWMLESNSSTKEKNEYVSKKAIRNRATRSEKEDNKEIPKKKVE